MDIRDYLTTRSTTQTIPDGIVRALQFDLRLVNYLTGDTITDPAAAHTPLLIPTNENVLHERQYPICPGYL